MLVYIFDKITGEFQNEYSPQINPKRPEEYIYPPNSTTIPPSVKKGHVAVFDGEKWDLIPDYRGKIIINPDTKEQFVVSDIGSIPDGLMFYDDYLESNIYKEEQAKLKLEEERQIVLSQIEELDKKRIRAICEPEQKTDTQSWLEYYTEQIVELRNKLKEL